MLIHSRTLYHQHHARYDDDNEPKDFSDTEDNLDTVTPSHTHAVQTEYSSYEMIKYKDYISNPFIAYGSALKIIPHMILGPITVAAA